MTRPLIVMLIASFIAATIVGVWSLANDPLVDPFEYEEALHDL